MNITVQVNDGGTPEKMEQLRQALRDFTPVWPAMREEFVAIEHEQFDTEGGAGGTPWEPLSPVYAAYKAKVWGSLPILQRDGTLLASLTDDLEIEETPNTLTMGTSVAYAIYHQLGTGRMPARPVIAINDALDARLTEVARRWVDDVVKEVFG